MAGQSRERRAQGRRADQAHSRGLISRAHCSSKPARGSPGRGFTGEFCQEAIPHKLFHKTGKKSFKSFYEASIILTQKSDK